MPKRHIIVRLNNNNNNNCSIGLKGGEKGC
jgi:hypothetical protein